MSSGESRAQHDKRPDPLGDFAAAHFGLAGVREACDGLRERLGLDISLLIACCWLAVDQGRRLSRRMLASIEGVTEPWQRHIVAPLRAARRFASAGIVPAHLPRVFEEAFEDGMTAEDFREAEIKASEVELALIRSIVGGLPAGAGGVDHQASVADLAAANVMTYVHARNLALDLQDRADLETLVIAAQRVATERAKTT